MAANSTDCRLCAAFLVLLLVFSGHQNGITVDADDEGTRFLDLRELYVKEIAGNASLNNNNCADLLAGCSAACSQATCNPVISSEKLNQCTIVDNNEHCGPGQGTSHACKHMLLDYNRSFVTLAPPGDVRALQTEVARDICLQRALDKTFMAISFPTSYSLVYLGSASGVWRGFPGRENNETQCRIFETRKRPWYLDAISVVKDVKILIDIGSTMASLVGADYDRPTFTTYLNVAQNISLELMHTLSVQDHIEVVSFDSRSANSLGDPVTIMSNNSNFNPATRPELQLLEVSVQSLAPSSEAGPSNLTSAIVKAVSSFVMSTTTLKVIIVITNGIFLPLNRTTFPSRRLLDHQAKVMIYKLLPNADADPFLLNTTLRENLCSINGSFVLLESKETTNPLYSMRSYFTYLARIHLAAVGNRPTWSNKYESASQLHNAITVTYPAFGGDGLLIGVAGVDVAIDDLNSTLRDLILSDFSNRVNGVYHAPTNIDMTCVYQENENSISPIAMCQNTSIPIEQAICQRTDTTSTLQERTCCNSCAIYGGGHDNGLKPWAIALICMAAALLLILTVVVVISCYHKLCHQEIEENYDYHSEPEE